MPENPCNKCSMQTESIGYAKKHSQTSKWKHWGPYFLDSISRNVDPWAKRPKQTEDTSPNLSDIADGQGCVLAGQKGVEAGLGGACIYYAF